MKRKSGDEGTCILVLYSKSPDDNEGDWAKESENWRWYTRTFIWVSWDTQEGRWKQSRSKILLLMRQWKVKIGLGTIITMSTILFSFKFRNRRFLFWFAKTISRTEKQIIYSKENISASLVYFVNHWNYIIACLALSHIQIFNIDLRVPQRSNGDECPFK